VSRLLGRGDVGGLMDKIQDVIPEVRVGVVVGALGERQAGWWGGGDAGGAALLPPALESTLATAACCHPHINRPPPPVDLRPSPSPPTHRTSSRSS